MADFIETGAVVETLPIGSDAPPTPAPNIEIKEISPGPAKPIPKMGKARERLFSELDKKAGIEPESPVGQPSEVSRDKKGGASTDEPPAEQSEAAESADKPTVEPEKTEVKPDEKGKAKVSPWKLVDTYKAKTKEMEKEIADLKSRIAPEKDFKAAQDELAKIKQAYEASQEFIRLHNYQASDEFKTKYQQPWEQAWTKAAKQMSEITVIDPNTGDERQAVLGDMEALVNAPLGRARKLADEMFGTFANDAMSMRGKIIELYEAQSEAIENAKKTGVERERQMSETQKQEMAKLHETVLSTWKTANDEAVNHPKYGQYFKPKDGDEEWNKRLASGVELVDKAFATIRPIFSDAEPREETIKRHAAMRNRAIAFGPLRHAYEKLVAERDEWKKKYEAISKSAPSVGPGAKHDATPAGGTRARDRVFAELDKYAAGH